MNNKGKQIKIAIIIAFIVATSIGAFFLLKNKKNSDDNNIKVDITYSDATPLLYKATDGKTDIYLLGSIHAADDSAYEFNKNILKYYDESKALAVEFDIIDFQKNLKKQTELAALMLYSDDTTIQDHIDESLYQNLTDLLKKKKVYNQFYDVYKPVMFESLLENALISDAGLDANKGIDMYFLNKAKKEKKQIIEIESAEFQYNMMNEFPDFIILESIKQSIDNYDEAVEDLKDLYTIWKEGNESKLEELLLEEPDNINEYTPEQLADLEKYNKMMLTNRNIAMANVLEEHMKKGTSIFCVVGLAHIVGDGGIVDLLQQRGYNVMQVNYSS